MVAGNKETIGLMTWISDDASKKIPKYVFDVCKISSKVFDKLYIITNRWKEFSRITTNVIPLNAEVAKQYIHDTYKGLPELEYQEYCDYIAYDAINILRLYGITCESVFKFDTDLVPYNKFLINQIANNANMKPFVATEMSHYLGNYGQAFYNCCLTYFNTSNDSLKLSKRLIDEWYEVVKDRGHKYTATGPGMLNRLVNTEGLKVNMSDCIDISIDTLKPTVSNTYYMKDDKLGLHLEASTYNKNKLTNKELRVHLSKDNTLKLSN